VLVLHHPLLAHRLLALAVAVVVRKVELLALVALVVAVMEQLTTQLPEVERLTQVAAEAAVVMPRVTAAQVALAVPV
jgi:hypothetical protein